MNTDIKRHLQEAQQHLQTALEMSIQEVKQNKSQERPVGAVWEAFLAEFFQSLRAKGKENKLNLLGLVSFTKLLRG